MQQLQNENFKLGHYPPVSLLDAPARQDYDEVIAAPAIQQEKDGLA